VDLEANKQIYTRYIEEAFNRGNLSVLDELLDPDYVYRDAPPGTPEGPAAIRQVVTMFRTGFPDVEITLDQLVAEGDYVCARATTRGTHRGLIFGLEPTGNAVTMKGMTMVRIANGKIVESWVKNDVAGLMAQLGAGG